MATEKRLIDVKHLTERIRKKDGIVCTTKRSGKLFDLCYSILMHFLETEPTVEAVEVVHSWWEKSAEGYSICHHCKADVAIFSGHKNYCPNCGANMQERKEQ